MGAFFEPTGQSDRGVANLLIMNSQDEKVISEIKVKILKSSVRISISYGKSIHLCYLAKRKLHGYAVISYP